jgi:hypothetical protein
MVQKLAGSSGDHDLCGASVGEVTLGVLNYADGLRDNGAYDEGDYCLYLQEQSGAKAKFWFM